MNISRKAGLTAGAAGVTAALLLAGGAAYASSDGGQAAPAAFSAAASGPSTTPARTTAAKARAHHLRSLARRAEYGTFTVHTKKHGNRTFDARRGTISSVTPATGTAPETVTVTSPDGTSAQFTLTSTSRVRNNGAKAVATTLAVGERARVLATKNGAAENVVGIRAHSPKATPKSGTTG